MAANIAQIFPLADDTQWTPTPLTAANTTRDGTSGTLYLAFTASANGDMLIKLRFQSLGSNAKSVARVFLNNGGATGTLANNTFLGEVALPQTTAIETDAIPPIEFNYGAMVKATYRVYCTLGTACTAGWQVTAVGSAY